MLVRRLDVDPFDELRQLQREMNSLFNGYVTGTAEAFPAVNIWSNTEQIIVTAELPGLDPADIDINVKRDQMTLQGERKASEMEDGVVCHRCERGAGRFTRSFTLPYEVDVEKINATYKDGVLTVTLPRSESSKPRRIEISSE
jgi:HSP20 family protein